MPSTPNYSFGEIADHQEIVTKHNRFASRWVDGQHWDFTHLEAFVLKVPIDLSPNQTMTIDVIVLFSNHCFTRSLSTGETVAKDWLFNDGRESRVLDRARYDLSKQHLRAIVTQLPLRHIFIADPDRPNYVTIEVPSNTGQKPAQYAVFFEVERDKQRKKRVLLRIQTAYVLEQTSKRLQQAKRINFNVLLRRAYL